jgi:hypothetical protein
VIRDTRRCDPQTLAEDSCDVRNPASVPKKFPRILCISQINIAKSGELFGAGDAEDVFDDDIRMISCRQIVCLGPTRMGLMKVAMQSLELSTIMVKRGCFTQSQSQEFAVNGHAR